MININVFLVNGGCVFCKNTFTFFYGNYVYTFLVVTYLNYARLVRM